jgi:hypothetical protein
MAELIKVDGTRTTVTPKNGKSFTLDEMQGFVGGYIEFVCLDDTTVMCLNEEGKVSGLRLNREATRRAAHAIPGDYIVGDVVIMPPVESGEDEDE